MPGSAALETGRRVQVPPVTRYDPCRPPGSGPRQEAGDRARRKETDDQATLPASAESGPARQHREHGDPGDGRDARRPDRLRRKRQPATQYAS